MRRVLDPVPGYYPAAVAPELFQKVQDQQQAGEAPKIALGGTVKSLLTGLAKCPSCGSTMTRVVKGKKGGLPGLVCTKARIGAGCEYVGVPQEQVEDANKTNFDFIAGTMPSGNEAIDAELEKAETALEVLREGIVNILEATSKNPSASLLEKLTELEAAKGEVEAEASRLARQASTMAANAVEKRMSELGAVLLAEPPDVAKANALLKQSLNSVTVDYATEASALRAKQGGETRVVYAWPKAAYGVPDVWRKTARPSRKLSAKPHSPRSRASGL